MKHFVLVLSSWIRLYFPLFAFYFHNYSVLKIFMNTYTLFLLKTYNATKDECQQSLFQSWATDKVHFNAYLFFRQNKDNKSKLWSTTCSVVEYLYPMFCLPEYYRRILYDWCNSLNNLWVFNSIKTYSVSTYINYMNLWWIHGTTSFSGHSTHNYN